MIILGIDPGTTTVGYAVIEKINREFRILDFWVIETTPKTHLENKLLEIWQDIWALIKKYKPVRLGIEKLFFNTNITTWIAVSHARWVILYECMKEGIEIFEYTPLQVKKAITGSGAAKKAQIQKALQIIFHLETIPTPDDAADAITLAYIAGLENSRTI